ncbi:MAG TPA: hypothetical protein VNB23_03080 [Ramlibacter sp.]|nr:hypothetical protein [Ramlibacter sp.]
MEEGTRTSGGEAGTAAGWRPWLRVAAAAALLLLVSEALWLWQTWPVRELLHSSGTAGGR